MRSSTLPFLAFLTSALANGPLPHDLSLSSSPFQDALTVNELQYNISRLESSPYAGDDAANPLELLRRDQGSCAAGYNSCSTLAVAFSAVCCPTTAVCSDDAGGNVACCPLGSYCTGTINPNTATSTGGASTATTTSGGAIVVGATTTSAASTTTSGTLASTTGSLSYVSNSYFPFPYIGSTFAAETACVSAYSACASNYALCSADLAGSGGGYGITVIAPGGGGVTVAAGATTAASLGAASASSICISLSSQACHGLQLTNCGVTGTSSATGFTIVSSEAGRTLLAREVGGIVGWSLTAVAILAVALAL